MHRTTLLFVFLALTVGAAAQTFEQAKAEFERAFYGQDPKVKIVMRNQAILGLSSNRAMLQEPRVVDLMYEVIDKADTWYDIGLTLQFFTNCEGEARARLAKDLTGKSGLSPRVREAITFMIADYGRFQGKVTEAEAEAILEVLDDDQVGVRRFAALACQGIPEGRAVDALLAQWEAEKDEGVISAIVDSLRQLTYKPELARDLDEWKSWREGNPEAEVSIGFQKADWSKADYGDHELELVDAGSSSGMPIWVLPPYGLTHSLYETGLSSLESVGRLTYIKLPVIGMDVEVDKDGEGQELYPVDSLVASLEELREERREPRIVLLGAFDTSFIMMRYAQLHPERVAAIVSFSGYLDDKAYAASLEAIQEHGTDEEKLYVQAAVGGISTDQATSMAINIGRLAAVMGEPTDVQGCAMWDKGFYDIRQTRRLLVPRIELEKKEKVEVPSLFLYGKDDETSAYSFTRVDGKKQFKPRARVTQIKDSGPMIWHDQPGEMLEEVSEFLEKYAEK